MLVGNKSDLIEENPSLRKVPLELVTDFCRRNGVLYLETSAKSGINVKEAFENLIESTIIMLIVGFD